MHLLFAMQTAFSLWMLYDCVSRGARSYWIPIILMPFGELVYFFRVKIHDPSFHWLRELLAASPRASLAELERVARQSPTFRNRLALGRALHDAESFGAAIEEFSAALAQDPTSLDARYGLALSHLGSGSPEQAAPLLEEILAKEPHHQDYGAWRHLVDALYESGKEEAALESASGLVRARPSLDHSLIQAGLLYAAERRDEAREVLERAMDAYATSPPFARRAERAAYRRARAALRALA